MELILFSKKFLFQSFSINKFFFTFWKLLDISYWLFYIIIDLSQIYVLTIYATNCPCDELSSHPLKGRVSMFRWMVIEDMDNIAFFSLLRLCLPFSLLIVSYAVLLGPAWS